MKNGKSGGANEIPREVWKSLRDEGIEILQDLMRKLLKQEKIPNEWRKSVMVPIFKGKEDVQEYANYRANLCHIP